MPNSLADILFVVALVAPTLAVVAGVSYFGFRLIRSKS